MTNMQAFGEDEPARLWVLGRCGWPSPVVLQVEIADFVKEAAEVALALQFGQLLPCHLHVVASRPGPPL